MLPERQQLSHYQLVGLLKSGGMGEVYLAVDTLLHRQVAIKVIHTDPIRHAGSDAAEEAKRLFIREAQAIAQLDQINILPIYDSGEVSINEIALMYMVMPYRRAGSMKDWLQTHVGPQLLPLPAVERIVTQAAFALQHAHDRQIIHQDVKPSNFLVHSEVEHPSRLNLQLADFGVAKFMMKTTDNSQVIRGTPYYMAPEQWEGRPVPATDQYALAAMAYELLTGRLPFQGGFSQLMYQHMSVQPQPPSALNPKLPRELDTVILRALAKNPEQRYSSVSAFAQAFTRVIMNSGNIHQTLMISELEARTGTNRILTLPDGKQFTLPIPPGAYQGQVIRLEGYGRPTTYTGPIGALILTIAIAPVEEGISPVAATLPRQAPVPTPVVKNNVTPTLPAVSARKSQARGGPILKIGFVLVLLAGIIGLGLAAITGAHNPNPGPTATTGTATNIAASCPSYLLCTGSLALSDPLSNDSKGYGWAPTDATPTPQSTLTPQYGTCEFAGGALHVTVYGANRVTFHPCVAERQSGNTFNFRNFAYEIKMRFITVNPADCGGVVFRSNDPKFYYFYICQNNYTCIKNSSQVCNYGLIRYTKDPADGPDYTLNPLLVEGFSQRIQEGSGQPYTIAIVAQGLSIDLYVNQQKIHSVQDNVQDPDYLAGTIGVLAKTFATDTTEVAFSDLRVWTF